MRNWLSSKWNLSLRVKRAQAQATQLAISKMLGDILHAFK